MEQQTATVAPVQETAPSASDFDVSSLLADDDAPAEAPKTEPVKVEEKVEAAPKIEAPVKAEPKPETKVETAPVAKEEAPAKKEAVVPEPSAPTEAPIDVKALRASTLTSLEKSFEITNEADVELLRSEPEKIIPKLVANAVLRTYEAVYSSIVQQLPAQLMGFSERISASKAAETQFSTRWPALADAKFHPEIAQVATAYKQLYPTLTTEQLIEEVGATLMVKHKLFATAAAQPAAPVVPTAMTTPVSPTRPGTVISDIKTASSPFAELLSED